MQHRKDELLAFCCGCEILVLCCGAPVPGINALSSLIVADLYQEPFTIDYKSAVLDTAVDSSRSSRSLSCATSWRSSLTNCASWSTRSLSEV